MRSQTVNIARMFFSLDMHVVLTALTDHLFIEAMGLTEYTPMLSTKASMEVPSHAEIVGRLLSVESLNSKQILGLKGTIKSLEGAFNVILLQGGRDFFAKWQGVKAPPDAITDPTARKLLACLEV